MAQGIEQAFPAEVAQHGLERVWTAWQWVCRYQVIAGQTTLGEAKQMTRERLATGTRN